MRFRLDRSTRRFDDGRVVVGGVPARLFRLTDAGAALVDRLVDVGAAPIPETPAAAAVVERLTSTGVLHPEPDPAPHGHRPAVTMVVPVRDRPRELAELLDSVRRSVDQPDEVVVVDDGSLDGPAHHAVADAHGARYLRCATPRGPGGARNCGLDAASHPVVVFVDSDVTVTPGWLAGLAGHLVDANVVAVAGRVRSARASGRLADYERTGSPLDLGGEPGPVGPGRRIGHVPAALLLVRRDAVTGGFDATMPVGEDVDLVWRLAEAGGVVRYEPRVVCDHRPRADLRSWWMQRFAYGTSAAALDERHPGSVTPWRASGWSLAVLAPAAVGWMVPTVVAALATSVVSARRTTGVPAVDAVVMAGRGHLGAATSFAESSVRVWWPVLLVALVASRTSRRVALRLLTVDLVRRWWNRGAPRNVGDLSLSVLDDLAYGSGVWAGCLRRRRLGPLRPSINR